MLCLSCHNEPFLRYPLFCFWISLLTSSVRMVYREDRCAFPLYLDLLGFRILWYSCQRSGVSLSSHWPCIAIGKTENLIRTYEWLKLTSMGDQPAQEEIESDNTFEYLTLSCIALPYVKILYPFPSPSLHSAFASTGAWAGLPCQSHPGT